MGGSASLMKLQKHHIGKNFAATAQAESLSARNIPNHSITATVGREKACDNPFYSGDS
tara:strand:+ start:6192 stop:6365 length:174 start_codon:yes stop_codon:yes gene_type:complete